MTKIKWIIGFATAAFLAGCSTQSIYEGKYNPDDGWRKGTVTEVGSGPKYIKLLPRDYSSVPGTATTQEKFAIIRYMKRNDLVSVAAPLTGEYKPKINDAVYVNIKDSNVPVFPRTEKESSFLPFALP